MKKLTLKKLVALALAAVLTTAAFSTAALAQDGDQPKDDRTIANEAAAWLLSQISDENSVIHEYFSTRPNKNTSLDSTGFNWGSKINPDLVQAIDGMTENTGFAWRIWQGGKGEGYNVFFTLTDISGADTGAKIANIVKVNSIEQQLISGAATVANKNMDGGSIKIIQNFVETPGADRVDLADLNKKDEPATDTDNKEPATDTDIKEPATDTDIKEPATDTDIKEPTTDTDNKEPATGTDIKEPDNDDTDKPADEVVPSAPVTINGIPLGTDTSAEEIPLSSPQTGSSGTAALAIALITVAVVTLAFCLRKATK